MRKYRIFLVVLLLIVLGILGYHNREFLFAKGGDTDVETQADSLPVVSSEGETECMVCPSGEPVGIYVKTKGVMVIGVNSVVDEQGITCNPCENLLSPGDYVMRINGQSVDDKKSMLELVQQSGGHELLLRVCRENEYRTVRVTPVKKKDGSYALGLWVKDDISGIGTITYTDGERFAALGHSINDNDTGIMFRVSDGAVYETTIVRIKSRKRISRDDWRASSIIPDGM